MLADLAAGGSDPLTIDRDKTIFAFYLSDLGWTKEQRDVLVDAYPYSLKQSSSSDAIVAGFAETCEESAGRLRPADASWGLVLYHFHTHAHADRSDPLGVPKRLAKRFTLATAYENQALTLAAVAADLGVAEMEVRETIRKDSYLRQRFKLEPLLEGDTVSRKDWEAAPNLTSAYQELSNKLGMEMPKPVH